jgi:hypothetical protein
MTNQYLEKFLKRRNIKFLFTGGEQSKEDIEQNRKNVLNELNSIIPGTEPIPRNIPNEEIKDDYTEITPERTSSIQSLKNVASSIGNTGKKVASVVGNTAVETANLVTSGVVSGTRIGSRILRAPVKHLLIDPLTKTSPENNLAIKFTQAIQSALKIVSTDKKYLENEYARLAKLVIKNPIDMNIGGGILLFGPDFQIQSFTHIFKKDGSLFSFENTIGSPSENDERMKNGLDKGGEPFDPATLAGSIKNNIMKTI